MRQWKRARYTPADWERYEMPGVRDEEDEGYFRNAGAERHPWPDMRGILSPGEIDRSQGKYSGIGPKGYQRTDQRIREDIYDRLATNDFVDPTEVTVEVKDGVATLKGLVPQRYMKYIAEDLAQSVLGVKSVRNHLRIDYGYKNPLQRQELDKQQREQAFDRFA